MSLFWLADASAQGANSGNSGMSGLLNVASRGHVRSEFFAARLQAILR